MLLVICLADLHITTALLICQAERHVTEGQVYVRYSGIAPAVGMDVKSLLSGDKLPSKPAAAHL